VPYSTQSDTPRRLYAELRLTERQMELLRRVLADAATGYRPSHPVASLLRKVENEHREAWPGEA
jgi:hypothetical protein